MVKQTKYFPALIWEKRSWVKADDILLLCLEYVDKVGCNENFVQPFFSNYDLKCLWTNVYSK